MAKKPVRRSEYRNIAYNSERWVLLKDLRKKAMQLMNALGKANLETVVHGSIARGDVTEKSDIDVLVQSQTSSFAVEAALEKANISASRRLVVQATPSYAMKAHIEIDESTSVSFPLMKLRKVEREFYKFGGEANPQTLKEGLRVPGVDKRLMLIEPTPKGHRESTIVGREEHAAKTLGISVETVLDRVHALLRRDTVGRTGVFVKHELSESETFEMALSRLADRNPAVRRRLASLH
jgi:predicted nucleotidyltransferase